MKRETESPHDFDSLFDLWNRRVYAYALKKTNSAYLAEEAVQRAFIKLWQHRGRNPDINVERQLFCIVRSTIIDLIRAEATQQKLKAAPITPMDHTVSPEEAFNAKELSAMLRQAIDAMPEMRRKVFIMSRFENLSHKEIAHRLLISPKTAENHINLALKTLKKSLLALLGIFVNLF